MYSFEGDFKRKPIQSLRGASKKEQKSSLLERTQAEREKRENLRRQQFSAAHIQAFYRSACIRHTQKCLQRAEFEAICQAYLKSKTKPKNEIPNMLKKLLFFYKASDTDRLIGLCQLILKNSDIITKSFQEDFSTALYRVKKLAVLCASYLGSIAKSTTAVAVPLRILELLLSPQTYHSHGNIETRILRPLHMYLVSRGYFRHLHSILDERVPPGDERCANAPTPLAESLFDLLKQPLTLVAEQESVNVEFRDVILSHFCEEFLCQPHSRQVEYFLLPALACGKWPFPFVHLLHYIVAEEGQDQIIEKRKEKSNQRGKLELSPWLLKAFLMLSENILDSISSQDFQYYLHVLRGLLTTLLGSSSHGNRQDEDSDAEDDMAMDTQDEFANLTSECIALFDSQKFWSRVLRSAEVDPSQGTISAICTLCHTLITSGGKAVHRTRLLYLLALNKTFMRQLWYSCVSVSTQSITGSSTPLLQVLSRGSDLSSHERELLMPLLSTFCTLFRHSIITLHDGEFFGEEGVGSSYMPFTITELIPMCSSLRDVCLGIIEIAYPDSRPNFCSDYVGALQSVGAFRKVGKQYSQDPMNIRKMWAYLFQAAANLLRQLYLRDNRRPYCPANHWISRQINIQADKPSQIFKPSQFSRQPISELLGMLPSNQEMEEEGPPLSTPEIRQLAVLTEIPFVVPFQERVKIFNRLIHQEKLENQNDMRFYGGPSIQISIRRNYIYEDAFDKLSPQNESNLKLRMQVQLMNVAGLDEAGIDGGGLFREFLSELLKTGFDPNRGFFRHTTDMLLYPNPQAQLFVDKFENHFYFLGRMLGKAIYERMLVELPFASFFLFKILSQHGGNVDIHHLASLDPEMYKNLLFLKHYDSDVADLGLNFTVVNNDLGEAQVEELKPGGHDICVTNNNRIEYIHLMAHYRLNKQIRIHTQSFRKGLADVVNLEWLRMFDYSELQVLISGAQIPIDLDDLKRNTHYSGGYSEEHPVIKHFWKVVETFNDNEKRQLLKFVTSCSRPPLLGFKELYPAFCIHNGGNEEDRLPTASTCMNLLKLPEFKTEQTMKNKLLYAVTSGAGFELS